MKFNKIKTVYPKVEQSRGAGNYEWLLIIQEPDEIDVGEYLIDGNSGPLKQKYRVLSKKVSLETQLFAKIIVEISYSGDQE